MTALKTRLVLAKGKGNPREQKLRSHFIFSSQDFSGVFSVVLFPSAVTRSLSLISRRAGEDMVPLRVDLHTKVLSFHRPGLPRISDLGGLKN